MKKADLYLIAGEGFSDLIQFCCRLTEKALAQGHKIHIQTEEAYQNEALNDALWSFKAESFLPHAVGQHEYQSHPITIDTLSISTNNEGHRDLLILLGANLPANFNDFKRMSILIPNNTDKIEIARKIYKQLKKTGLEVNIHDLRK